MKYKLTFELRPYKEWRGVKVPFTLRVRYHYPTGSRIIWDICGADFEWYKRIHQENYFKQNKGE